MDKSDDKLRNALGKAISAFANSGGGHLILGVTDSGDFDGVPLKIGKTSSREWLEQKVCHLVDHPLSDYRVHDVERADDSKIPKDRTILVVDVGDSLMAPHQSRADKLYYHRVGGHSLPAAHFYIETLRNRILGPALEVSLTGVEFGREVLEDDDHAVFLGLELVFRVKNVGRFAAYKWALDEIAIDGFAEERINDYVFDTTKDFPKSPDLRKCSVRSDDTILPGMSMKEKCPLGIRLRPASPQPSNLEHELKKMMDVDVHFAVVSETSRGEKQAVKLQSIVDTSDVVNSIVSSLDLPVDYEW